MKLTTFRKVGNTTDINIPTETLQALPCGLHRATLAEAPTLVPELSELFQSASELVGPENIEDWYIDVKIHMLMPGQFPCIPNWHCDNVPRNEDKKLNYGAIQENVPPMYLWISNGPHTEFLPSSYKSWENCKDHGELDLSIKDAVDYGAVEPVQIPAQQWISMLQNTPHRGVAATENGWRIFARLSHKSLVFGRAPRCKIRRHAQVYLPANFHW